MSTEDHCARADWTPAPPRRQKERDQFIFLTGNVNDLTPEERLHVAAMAAAEPDPDLLLEMMGLKKDKLREDRSAVEEKHRGDVA